MTKANLHLNAIFDIGKTRSRLVLIDADGELAHVAEQSSGVIENGDYSQLDSSGTWQWMLQALRDSALASDIRRCVVATHGAAFALLEGEQLGLPIMDYEFDDFGPIDTAYDAIRDGFEQTYSPRLPAGLNAGRQIYYLQQTQPRSFSRVTSIVPYPQYWAFRLSGELANEVTSLGSHTDLWQPENRAYSALAVANGWATRMPPVKPAWSELGTVLPDVAEKSGLNPECRIYCGIHDSNASYLRHLKAGQSPFTVVSTGTWVVCMASGQSLETLDARRDMLANVDVLSNPVACARFMGGREYAALLDGETGGRPVSLADAQEVMANGRFALPSFTASGGPFPDHEGRLLRPVKDPQSRGALASLYCALLTDICLDNLGASGDLILEGRFVRDLIFVEALSHFRGQQDLRVSDDETGTISGAQRLFSWPDNATIQPPLFEAAGSAADFTAYRDRWRELLTNKT